MRKTRTILCGGLLTALLCCPADAGETNDALAPRASVLAVDAELEVNFLEFGLPEGEGPSPRGVCGTTVYSGALVSGANVEMTPVGSPDQNMGDTVTLAGVEREICEVTVTIAALSNVPADITMTLWTDCPVVGNQTGPPVGNCGANLNASIIPGSTITVNWVPATPGVFETVTFTYATPVLVKGNDVTLMFHASRPAIFFSTDAPATVGSSANTYIRCSSSAANNGCGRLGGAGNPGLLIQAVAQLGVGACCLGDATCVEVAGSQCSVMGGNFLGEGSLCTNLGPNGCQGACCGTALACQTSSRDACLAAGGIFFGATTECSTDLPNGCVGACCAADGSCTDVSEDDCVASGGTFTDLATNCAEGPCLGACCAPDGSCTEVDSVTCAASGGVFQGLSISCASVVCFIQQECMEGGSGQLPDNGAHGAGGVLALTSDLNPQFGFRGADNFTPTTDGTITSVRWWGLHRDLAAGTPCAVQSGDSSDNFTITFWSNLLDLPDQVIASFAVTPTVEDTGNPLLGHTTWRYEATLPGLGFAVEANTCYWIQIANNTSGACGWLWLTAPAGDLKSAQSTAASGPYVAGDELDHDQGACVDLQINADGCDSDIEPQRACCPPPGQGGCQDLAPSACVAINGIVGAADSVCTAASCDGACCVSDGQGGFNCSITPEITCFDNGGVWNGAFSTCESQPCSGACCLFDGTCNEGVSLISCANFPPAGGVYHGGLTCADVNCGAALICDATPIDCGASTTVDNSALASNPTPPVQPVTQSCFGGAPAVGPGAFWLRFTGTGDDVQVSLCNSDVSDTIVSVYTRAGDPGIECVNVTDADEVACNEDLCAALSEVCVPATVSGQTYWVLVSSFDANSVGSIQVDITCPCPFACDCVGDGNGDGLLTGADVQAFVDCAIGGSASEFCDCADADDDGDIDEVDAGLYAEEIVNSSGQCE